MIFFFFKMVNTTTDSSFAGQQDFEVVMMTHPKPDDIEKPSDFEEQVGDKSCDANVSKREDVKNSILYVVSFEYFFIKKCPYVSIFVVWT